MVEENPFSSYYGQLLHQQNMLQDHVRTSTYEKAMLLNPTSFKDKIVLDVGTGTAILAYFAIKAGAKRVYAVELSDMSKFAHDLIVANGLEQQIIILQGKIEEIDLPEQVDIVISEPMGFFLVHERMLESYVTGRTRFLKPGGLMFPSVGTMFVCPFSDDSIYQEQMGKTSFWQQRDFYGLDLSVLSNEGKRNHFSQPVVGYFPSSMLISPDAVEHSINFGTVEISEFESFDIPLHFVINRTAIMHGLGCWFSVDFCGEDTVISLSTAPTEPGTHWYQCRLLLSTPIAVNTSQTITGNLHFVANKKFSYDIDMEVNLCGTTITSKNKIYLQDQMYHYLHSGNPGATDNVRY